MSKLLITVLATALTINAHASTITASAGPNSISAAGTVSFSSINPTGIYRSDATAGYGSITAESYANCGSMAVCSADAGAYFTDTITITDINGYIQLQPLVYAHSDFGDGVSNAIFTMGGSTDAFQGSRDFNAVCPGCVLRQAFTSSTGVTFSARVYVQSTDYAPQDAFNGSESDQASISFGLSVLDSNRNPATNFHYMTSSGHDYGIGGTLVGQGQQSLSASLIEVGVPEHEHVNSPEPAAALLIASGIGFVLGRLKGRRSR